MRAPSPWAVLGLKGPVDRSEVRRAYARRLKQVSPEDDPKGFEQLRSAYEAALAIAGTARPEEPDPIAGATDAVQPPGQAEATGEDLSDAAADVLGPAARAARDRVQGLLAGPGASDRPALRAALDELLAPAALEAISARADTELWLAALILANMPRSDYLLDEAFSRFRWTPAAQGRDVAPVILRVIGRREDMAARDELRRPGHPHHKAFLALTSASGRRLALRGLFAPGLAGDVRDLLRTIRAHHLSLIRDLDPAALAWWDEYLARGQAPPLALWCGIVALIGAAGGSAAALHAPPIDRLLAALAALAACLCLIGLEQFVVTRAMRSWKSRGGGEAPAWLRLGWAPACAVLLVAAPNLPAGPVSATVVLGAEIACVWWMIVTGARDGGAAQAHLIDRVNAALPTLYGLPFLLFTWSLFVCHLSGVSVFSATAAALIGGFVVAVGGEARLRAFWSGAARRQGAAGLSAVCLIAAGLLVATFRDPGLWPSAAGLVAMSVLADTAPLGLARWRPTVIYRAAMLAAGALAVLPGLAILFEGSASLRDDVVANLARLGGAFLLVGPLLSVAEILRGGSGGAAKAA